MTKGVILLHKNIKNKLSELRIDEGSDFLFPHIEFNSNRQVTIDGSKGVIEYNSSVVRLNCGNMILKFCGDDIEIKAAATEQIVLSGQIISFEFCSI